MQVSESVEGLERFPINLRYPQSWRDSPERLESLPVVTPSGAHVPLAALADIRPRATCAGAFRKAGDDPGGRRVMFSGVLSLAAVNTLASTPALLSAASGAGVRLRRAIRLEAALVAVILLSTAALTTVSSPPGPGQGGQVFLAPPPLVPAHQTSGDAS